MGFQSGHLTSDSSIASPAIARNYLINGRHEMNQRGTSKNLTTANGFFLVDRFGGRSVNALGPAETTLLATVLTGGPDGMQYIRLAPQSASTRIGWGQRIENHTLADLPVGTRMVLSAYVKRTTAASAAGTEVRLRSFTPGSVHAFSPFSDMDTTLFSTSYNGLSDTVFTRITAQLTITQAMKDNGLQVGVQVVVTGEGSALLTGNTIEITGMTLTVGDAVTANVPRHEFSRQGEENACYRYYGRLRATSQISAGPYVSGGVRGTWWYPARMRAVPTLTVGGTLNTDIYYEVHGTGQSGTVSAASMSIGTQGTDCALLQLDFSVAPGTNAGRVIIQSNGYLEAEAEL